jgi:hypothetical protein
MLQWTCRLRDVLESRGLSTYGADSVRLFSEMREAEFVPGDGAFPNGFRWEDFQRCFYCVPYESDRIPLAIEGKTSVLRHTESV